MIAQGRHQRSIIAQLRRQPQNSYPLPHGVTARAEQRAVLRLVDKGLVTLESCGRRYRIERG